MKTAVLSPDTVSRPAVPRRRSPLLHPAAKPLLFVAGLLPFAWRTRPRR
jgi:sulfoxide reductase heme-binding subunit YedZ